MTILLLLSTSFGVGCVNFQEKRAITAFQSGLEAENLEVLREKSTDRFSSLALRHPDSQEALKQLKLPDGKFKVLEVEDVSETSKKVTLGFGEDHRRKIQYRLVKEENSKNWKVDDIYLRQRSGDKALVMAVTDQMDVLLSAREFYESWSSGDRGQVLGSSNGEMAGELAKLPPSVLAKFTVDMIGSRDRNSVFRPEAHISGEEAVVRLNRSHGTLVMTMHKSDTGSWHVKDLALESRGKAGENAGIDSLTELAKSTNLAMQFLDAWNQGDKETLKQVSEERFFASGLAPANLKDLPLPASYEVTANIDVKILETHTDIVVQAESQTVCLRLNESKPKSGILQVADVTVYDLASQQNLSLSSAMTATPIAEMFVEALRQRDQKMLQYGSTMDLNKKLWGRISPQTLALLPIPIEEYQQAELLETRHAGEITQVFMKAGPQKLIVVLRDQSGKVVVDDLLISPFREDVAVNEVEASARSLKQHLGAIAPVYELASCVHHNQPKTALRLVTDDFYDRVFSLAKTMPESSYTLLEYVSNGQPEVKQVTSDKLLGKTSGMTASLIQPTTKARLERPKNESYQTVVEFNTLNGVMQVTLREEQELLRVDDAVIVSSDNETVLRLKQDMRMELASRRSRSMIQTVSGETVPAEEKMKPAITGLEKRPQTANLPANSQSELPNTSLQNALYEEVDHQQAPLQLMQGKMTPENGAIPATADPLKKVSEQEHLLLQPIPLE